MNLDSNCIKFSLDIKDPNLTFTDYLYKFYDGIKHQVYKAVLDIDKCAKCNSTNFLKNGYYTSEIHYITANASLPVRIILNKRRIICRSCGANSMASTSLVDKSCHISNAIKQKATAALTEDRSMTSIATENNISVNTVQRQLERFESKFIDEDLDELPEHLAFDEFRGVGKVLHFICIDGDTHTIVKILPNRYKKDITDYFMKFSPQTRSQVKTVSMDLNCYYPEIVRAVFPNAKVVLDRFHMVQMLTRSFNSLRVQIMKQFDKQTQEYKMLKYHWKLFLKKYSDLEKSKTFYDWHTKNTWTQEHLILAGLESNESLKETYWLMQDFMEALDKRDSNKVKELIHKKSALLGAQMKTTLKTFIHYQSGVLNGISNEYSNGCLEGKNRKIKQIQRTAFGYRNFKHMLIRIRLEDKLPLKQSHQLYSMAA